jgi:hypothetical protein
VADLEDNRDFIRFVQTVLISLRRTLDMPFEAMMRQKEDDGARLLRSIIMDLESARLLIAPLRSVREPPREILGPLSSLSRELTRVVENREYVRILRTLKYRRVPDGIPTRTQPRPLPRVPDLDVPHALAAIEALIERITDFAAPSSGSAVQRELFQLRSIIPAQKIAPAQFEIRNDRLTVKKHTSNAQEEDKGGIESARSQLQKNGDKIIEELERSNCDRRLLSNIQHLQAQLVDETDAIKIGLTNLSCEFMCSAFDHELPSAVSSMLKAHTRGIQLFVGQFPEWNRFLENAATAHLENNDVEALRVASEQLVGTLRSKPDVVDPEVPRTLAYLTQLLENPGITGKRAAFAVLRSMENLISLVFNYGAEFGQKTISKTIDSASSAASKMIVMTLLTIALGGAASIGPIASKVPEMTWLQTASEIVRKQLEKMLSEK